MNFVNRPETITAEATAVRVRGAVRTARTNAIALIDGRTLERECFVRTMELANPRVAVVGHSSFAAWKSATGPGDPASVVIFSIGARAASSEPVAAELRQLVEAASPTPVVVLGESEDLRDMIAAVEKVYDDKIAGGLLPQRRMGEPRDIARAVAAIAGGLLDYSAGQVLNVDGGFHLRSL